MPDYPDSKRGFLMKGALIELRPAPIIKVLPSITIFQYNPASLSRSIQPSTDLDRDPPCAASSETDAANSGCGTADESRIAVLPDDPKETFNLNLVIDAYDDLNEGNKLGVATGIADRLASLEMLLYPNTGLFDQALDAIGDAIGKVINPTLGWREAEETQLATVKLFYFGPGKIVPIRITSLTIDEQQFHATLLYPIRAEVTVGIEILREAELKLFENEANAIAVKIARGCYIFTREQKSILATIGGPIRLVDSALTGINPDLGDIL